MERKSWFPIIIEVDGKAIWCEHNTDVPIGVGFYVRETRVDGIDFPQANGDSK